MIAEGETRGPGGIKYSNLPSIVARSSVYTIKKISINNEISS